jgi:nicotinamidase-related amidase
VFHVRHLSTRPGSTFFLPGTKGQEIHAAVAPLGNEAIVEKNFPNSFRATKLEEGLKSLGVKNLVVAGMMTHMCVDATVRHAADLGYRITLPRRRLRDARAEDLRRDRARTPGAPRVPCRSQRFLCQGDRQP